MRRYDAAFAELENWLTSAVGQPISIGWYGQRSIRQALAELKRKVESLEQAEADLRRKVVEYFVAEELESQLLTIERFQVLPPSELEAEAQAIENAHHRTAAAYRALREVALDEINALYGDAGSAQEDV